MTEITEEEKEIRASSYRETMDERDYRMELRQSEAVVGAEVGFNETTSFRRSE